MAVKSISYGKTFISQTYQKDMGTGPERYRTKEDYKDFQRINDKDYELRKEIIKNFSMGVPTELSSKHVSLELLNSLTEGRGFDGEFNYSFKFHAKNENSPFPCGNSSSKNEEYQTFIMIRKAGKHENLEKLSDLEKFLIENDFKEVEEFRKSK